MDARRVFLCFDVVFCCLEGDVSPAKEPVGLVILFAFNVGDGDSNIHKCCEYLPALDLGVN
jgi:hypothetical protein